MCSVSANVSALKEENLSSWPIRYWHFSLGLEYCSEETEGMARRDCFGWLCEIAVRRDGETR